MFRNFGPNKIFPDCSFLWVIAEISVVTLIPYTVYHALFTIHRLPYTVYHTLFTIYRLPYTVYHTPFTIHCLPYTIYHTQFTIYCLPYTVYHTSFTYQQPGLVLGQHSANTQTATSQQEHLQI